MSGGNLGGVDITDILEDVGYDATTSKEHFKVVLGLVPMYPNLDQPTLAKIIGTVAQFHRGLQGASGVHSPLAASLGAKFKQFGDTARLGSWNTDVIVDTLLELAPHSCSMGIVNHLDYKGFVVPDHASFLLLVHMLQRLSPRMIIPVNGFCGRVWQERRGQLSLIRHAVLAPPEVLTFSTTPRQQAPIDGLHGGKLATGSANYAWMSLDLLDILCKLADTGLVEEVRGILEVPLKHCQEVLLIGLVQCQTQWGVVQNTLIPRLMPMFLAGHPNSGIVLGKLWHLSRETVVQGMMSQYSIEPGSVPRALELSQELKVLSEVLALSQPPFVLELAALAARREYLNLEKWLQETVQERGVPFFESCVSFLREKIIISKETSMAQRAGMINLAPETAHLFFRVLDSKADIVPKELYSEFHALYNASVQKDLQLTRNDEVFSPDIEEEANINFQKIYTGQQSIEEMVRMLKDFQSSSKKRERDIFSCMVHNLFDEYRFFPKYPDKELRITSVLFGQLVQQELLVDVTLGIALQYILDALNKPAGSKIFSFGVNALDQFKNRLPEWTNYCRYLSKVPHIGQAPADIISIIEQISSSPTGNGDGSDKASIAMAAAAGMPTFGNSGGGDLDAGRQAFHNDTAQLTRGMSDLGLGAGALQGGEHTVIDDIPQFGAGSSMSMASLSDPQKEKGASGVAAAKTYKAEAARQAFAAPSFATQLNIDTLVQASAGQNFEDPGPELEDKIHFTINNLSANNMAEFSGRLSGLLAPEYYPWFANYMVVKRASIEPNFHSLYLTLLKKLNISFLYHRIVAATVANVRALLSGDKIKSNSSERSLLKNLGSWLGQLTLARNKPLLQRDVDVKALLYEAYKTGKMIAVVPFVSKILESCNQSKVFVLPNPWIHAILALITEIYFEKDLKLNLKFEIEMLFKQMGVELGKAVQPSHSLTMYTREVQNNPDFTSAEKAAHLAAMASQKSKGATPSAAQAVPLAQIPQQVQRTQAAAAAQGIAPALAGDDQQDGDQLSNISSGFASGTSPALGVEQSSNLESFIAISPALSVVAEKLNLKRLLTVAVDRAIREVISPVVDRSVTIACTTARELVTKDFQMEPDDTKVRNAAHLMVSCLVGSLALVTSREPLRVSMTNQLKQMIVQSNVPIEQSLLEQVAQVAANDNVELGCALIEKAATEKAIRDIDEALANQYDMRRKHRTLVGHGNFDMSVIQQPAFPSSLPEALAPKPAGLSQQQQRIYEDFSTIPRALNRVMQQQAPSQLPGQARQAAPDGITPAPSFVPALSGEAGEDQSSMSYGGAFDGGTLSGEGEARAPKADGQAMAQSGGSVAGSVLDKVRNALARLDGALTKEPGVDYPSLAPEHEVRAAVAEVGDAVFSAPNRNDAGFAVAQVLLKWLYDGAASRLGISAVLAVLERLKPMCNNLSKDLTGWLLHSIDEETFFSQRELCEDLIRAGLIGAQDVDSHISRIVASGRHAAVATEMAVQLVRQLAMVECCVPATEFPGIIGLISKLASRAGAPEVLVHLAEQAHARIVAATREEERPRGMASNSIRGREGDPPGLREQVANLFEDWARICESSSGTDKSVQLYFAQLHQAGFLKGDDVSDRFFRLLTEMSISHCLSSEGAIAVPMGVQPPLSFAAVDAYAKMVYLLVNFAVEKGIVSHASFLSRVLAVAVSVLQRDAEESGPNFNARPWFRLFLGWIVEISGNIDPASLTGPDSAQHFAVLSALVQTLRQLQPLRVPAFTFAWLELMSHRTFMPRLLLIPGQKGWPMVLDNLVSMLRFLEPFLRGAELTEATRLLYRGALRILLVLLHDFPEFLCDNHVILCDVVPSSCIQMRNLILSAFPRNMRLPDPFTPNLKVDLLPEISQPPRMLDNPSVKLNAQLRADIDTFVKTRKMSDLSEVRSRLILPTQDAVTLGARYNVPQLNALVLYVGLNAILQLKPSQSSISQITQSVSMEIFQHLIIELDSEGRYLFVNALANQLRYPNNQTHYFSCVLLYLFAESHQEIVQEHITRVLLERLIVNRPHPWGLLITFIELIKNPRYNFWSHKFTRCAPEIERLFESVARSCMGSARNKGDEDFPSHNSNTVT